MEVATLFDPENHKFQEAIKLYNPATAKATMPTLVKRVHSWGYHHEYKRCKQFGFSDAVTKLRCQHAARQFQEEWNKHYVSEGIDVD